MKAPMQLYIPEPCHENWDGMTPQDKGRHCQSCNKIVVDFSTMTDQQVLNYFKTTTGSTCGRFHTEQLQRPLIERQERPTRWKYFLASIIGFILGGKLWAQNRPIKERTMGKPAIAVTQLMGDTILPKKTGEAIGQTEISANRIKGKVMNEKGAALAGITVLQQATQKGTLTNKDGLFEIFGNNNRGPITLIFSGVGFETKKVDIALKDLNMPIDIILKPFVENLKEVILETNNRSLKGKIMLGGISSASCRKPRKTIKDTLVKKVQQVLKIEPVKIYPNPVQQNATIHLVLRDKGTYQLHLFDVQSRMIVAKDIETVVNNETVQLQLPANITAGNYFLQFMNTKNKKQFTEKIIVE